MIHGWGCGGPLRCPQCAADAAQEAEARRVAEERAVLAARRAGHRLRTRVWVPRRPAGWTSMAWQVTCDCGEWCSEPVAFSLAAPSQAIIANLRVAGEAHVATAAGPETAEQALARWVAES